MYHLPSLTPPLPFLFKVVRSQEIANLFKLCFSTTSTTLMTDDAYSYFLLTTYYTHVTTFKRTLNTRIAYLH